MLGFGYRPALDPLGQHRGARLADGATLAAEGDIFDELIGDPKVDVDLVAADRVQAFHAVAAGCPTAIPRPPVMVEDDLTIKVVKLGFGHRHQRIS